MHSVLIRLLFRVIYLVYKMCIIRAYLYRKQEVELDNIIRLLSINSPYLFEALVTTKKIPLCHIF